LNSFIMDMKCLRYWWRKRSPCLPEEGSAGANPA
jgi:hypothetical protein